MKGALALLLVPACQCGRSNKESAHVDPPIIPSAPTTKRAAKVRELEELWKRAESEEADDLAALARAEGGAGLVEGADETHRKVALLAVAYTDDFVALPWAGDVASGSDKELRLVAAESFVRAVTDRPLHREPEDALELQATCKKWLEIGKSDKSDASVRRLAGRGLRMLGERCFTSPDALAGVP